MCFGLVLEDCAVFQCFNCKMYRCHDAKAWGQVCKCSFLRWWNVPMHLLLCTFFVLVLPTVRGEIWVCCASSATPTDVFFIFTSLETIYQMELQLFLVTQPLYVLGVPHRGWVGEDRGPGSLGGHDAVCLDMIAVRFIFRRYLYQNKSHTLAPSLQTHFLKLLNLRNRNYKFQLRSQNVHRYRNVSGWI